MSGPPGAGTGPTPLSAVFSDRAGEESFENSLVDLGADPLARALRMLDSITAMEPAGTGELRAVADAPASVGADTAVAGESGPGGAAGTAPPEAPSHDAPTTSTTDSGTTTAPGRSRREEILDGASALFAERGYHGASLRDISRRVGISHPGMLHHFPSKDALLGAVIDRLEAHAQGLLDSVSALQNSPQSLVAALAGPWDPRQHPMALLATLSAEIVNPDHPGRYRIARLRLVHENVLERALAGLAANDRLVAGADPAFLARTLFSLLLSLTVREHTVRELQSSGSADPLADVQEFVRRCVNG
ncbi:TetR/AcrR family transcriptional regulator [Brachybacterium sp. UNK5269]|uniref:TetR/AcrR family transcriptional regulator n=1 Tax=Brachybacterium sp. UNK5269 TaxID=3408576 RepID=UPI003BAFC66D